MLRKYLIQRYVNVDNVEELLGHSSFVYLRGMLIHIAVLFVIYVGYAIWHYYDPSTYVQRIIGVVGLFWFTHWVLNFLNLYLDCLLLSKDTLTVFLWDGLLEYRTEVLDWSKINAITYTQNSLMDRIFGKGDLVIQLGSNADFKFYEVSNPKKDVARLLIFKKNHEESEQQKIEDDLKGEGRKFEVIIDALGEVVKEYLAEKGGKKAGYYEEEIIYEKTDLE